MILFAAPEFEAMATGLQNCAPSLKRGHYAARRFSNGELFIHLDTSPTGEECVILASIAPPDERLLTTMLLAHTLRKEGARQITGVLPYLAYSRQDKNKPEESLAAAWTGSVAFASGFDRMITVDVHSCDDERLYQTPLISISPAVIFGAALKRYQLTGATMIAPDKGAVRRCEAIRTAAGLDPASIPWFEKHRDKTEIQHARFVGEVGTQAVLVGDILDTGATLISACKRIFLTGVEDIEVIVTHALFTGTEWQRLWQLGVSRIFCTDTVPRTASTDDERIVTISVVPLITDALTN